VAIKVFKFRFRRAAKPVLSEKKMDDSDKIMVLNRLLAARSAAGRDFYASASKGVCAALSEMESGKIALGDFAKSILKIYDPEAAVEVVEIEKPTFDPLFALPMISSAIKRLSGFERAVLIVCGLDARAGGKRASRQKREAYAENIELIEAYAMRYAKAFPNLEILFV